VKIHSSYLDCLPYSISLQLVFLTIAHFQSDRLFLLALVPAVAYWIITPIIVFRHPVPSRGDLQMVRSGFLFNCVFSVVVLVIIGTIRQYVADFS
jgi:hypothetical protein